ncbi:MAG: polysaccharide deacetylase family protein [Bacteroidales bacterium]|nr:polysaccharide deacetylase family protein [Bacteroidales bacterium]
MNDLTIIMYHYVRDLKNSRFPEIKGLDICFFKEQLAYLKKHYHFVTAEQVIAAFKKEEKLPPKAVLLTFDDAYIDHFTNVFPILEHHKIQGCFYPPVKAITEHSVLDVNKVHFILAATPKDQFGRLLETIKQLLNKYQEEYQLDSYDYYFEKLAVANRFDPKEVIFVKRLLQVELPEKLRNIVTKQLFTEAVKMEEEVFSRELYMNKDQMRCMVECGMHIGSHGYDHYWLGSLPKEKQEDEIQRAISFINEIGGDIHNWTMCYPYGNYNNDTIDILKKTGCQFGLTTRVDLASVDSSEENAIFTLPRLDTNDIPKQADAPANEWFQKAK